VIMGMVIKMAAFPETIQRTMAKDMRLIVLRIKVVVIKNLASKSMLSLPLIGTLY